MQSDCDSIISFYKGSNLKFSNENCCNWSNIQCKNNKIYLFQYINDNNEKIDFSTFPILGELTDLIIQGKYLLGGSVPTIFFSQPKLMRLILDNSNIWEIPNIINSASSSSIESISLKNNLLTAFPYFLRNMPHLKSLNISENKINEELTNEISQFPSLEILNISSNFMTGSIPEIPSSLKELYIDNNQFSSLKFSYSQSPNLEIFSGNNNKLGNDAFKLLTEFQNMKNISLENTELTGIPSSINNLSKLRYLSLKNNDIDQLPEEFNDIKYLEELNLSGNSKLKGKIKSGAAISKCYLSHTADVCVEYKNICSFNDSQNICGQSKGSSLLSNMAVVFLSLAIISLLIYIIHFLYKLKKEKNRMKNFSRMSKSTKGNSESFANDSLDVNCQSLRSKTSKEVINTINEAVSHLNSKSDSKTRSAEIAFSNGMKIVGSANEAFNLAKDRNQKPQLKEIFKDIDSLDGEITDHLFVNLERDDNQISNNSNDNNFKNNNQYPSLSRSVISNPCTSSEAIIPQIINYSLPRNNNIRNIMLTNTSNALMNNNNMNMNMNINNGITNNNNNNNLDFRNNSKTNNNHYSKVNSSTPYNSIEIKTKLLPRSILANSSEFINNNNMNILKLNARDTVMPGVRKDNANEYTNKINNINSEINTQSQLYKNGILNNTNCFNLENFNNYNVINNTTGINSNGQIHLLNSTIVNPNNNQTSPILVALPILPYNTNSLNRNQTTNLNKLPLNNTIALKELPSNQNQPLNDIYRNRSIQENIPSLTINSSNNSIIPINHNLSISSKSNSITTDTNITNSNSISLSSFSVNNSSFSDEELSKNILFQNPSPIKIKKNNSSIRKGYSNSLKPIFNHKGSLKSVGDKSVNSGNISSSFDLHIDSMELDDILNEINLSK
ncbi:hypothetical protein BCR36DRAFT_410220 [Piromyces finnis]|uniref:L domain-like protein n=1 Tax=Piromyces finnis TaxID=1754191 RepID=A0A1Y1VGK4_9FUNG|nr:hypothetical protein BCR36DRAFT_410220 [Piromyces finnis]|eukprot:ORX55280.1 hypothetical protein BCR36DRAFT_410220 [Piromyces finnis]